jgi:predicted DNA-binding protein (MmcQ/YjbR family)
MKPADSQGLSLLLSWATLQWMSRTTVNDICRPLPGAECSDPWGGGHDAWKIGGKMFACVGTMDDGVSVKTPDIETAAMLIDAGVGIKAPYFHRSWIKLPWGTNTDELRHRIETSYDLVRGGLTKKFQATLPSRTP